MTVLQSRQSSILIVEDNADCQDAMAVLLRAFGYAVAAVNDGEAALQYLRAHAPPCLIMLDLMMPRMNGFEFRAVQLKDKALATIPVALTSAHRDVSEEAASLGAVGYLTKPYEIEELLDIVARHCGVGTPPR